MGVIAHHSDGKYGKGRAGSLGGYIKILEDFEQRAIDSCE